MKREQGFTLLEALTAITIFSLVVVALYGGFRIAARSWEAGERTQSSVADLRLAGDFLRRNLGQAFPLAVADRSTWRLWFRGEPDGVVFATAMPAYLGQGGIYQMTLNGERNDEGTRLMVSRRLLHPDLAAGGETREEDAPRVLIEGLKDLDFAYFGVAKKGEEARWHDRWEDAQRLPDLVRVRLDSREAGAWPELVVRLRADGIRYQRAAAPGAPGQQEPSMPPIEGELQ